MKEKALITRYGLFASIVVTVIGVGIFSYPSEVSSIVGSDGWITTIISGIISYFLLYLIYIVVRKNNYANFYDILNTNLGTFFSKVVALIFVSLNIISIAIGLRIFAEVVKMYLLQKTPTEFILIAMIMTTTYLIRGEVDALIKFNEIAFWIMFIPIIFIIIFSLNNTDFTNIFPVLNNKPLDYINAVGISIFSFAGYQIAYFIIPLTKDRNKINRTLFKSITFITLFYTIITLLCLAIFNVRETSELLWPTITMIKSIDIPGAFIERWEGVVMALWVIYSFTTIANIYYFSADTIKRTFKMEDIKLSSLIIIPFIYIIALYPGNIGEVYYFSGKIILFVQMINLMIIPLLLLFITVIKKRSEKYEK